MAADGFRAAFDRSGLTAEQFAEIVGVDPKTVQRWIAGRTTPYRRYRVVIARALDVPAHELWPDDEPAGDKPQGPGRPPEEVVRSWGGREEIDISETTDTASLGIDVLAPSPGMLTGPTTGPALQRAADRGCRIRILAPAAAIEIDQIKTLVRHPPVEIRILTDFVAHGVYRADDTALLEIWLIGEEGQPFVLAHRQRDHGLFDTITSHFDKLWADHQPPTDGPPPTPQTNQAPGDNGQQDAPKRVRKWQRK